MRPSLLLGCAFLAAACSKATSQRAEDAATSDAAGAEPDAPASDARGGPELLDAWPATGGTGGVFGSGGSGGYVGTGGAAVDGASTGGTSGASGGTSGASGGAMAGNTAGGSGGAVIDGNSGLGGVARVDGGFGGTGGTDSPIAALDADNAVIDASDAPAAETSCGTRTTAAAQLPTDVMLVLDRSGTMVESISEDCCCDDACRRSTGVMVCPDTTACVTRWPAMISALETTFSQTVGIQWGLKLFPTPDATSSSSCLVTKGIEVPIQPGSAAQIRSVVQGVTPSSSTPTARAVEVTTEYLKTIADQSSKVILLATDGQPNCAGGSSSSSDVQGTARAISAARAAGFRVFVIGIGPAAGNLDEFANAGGTDHYYPASSASELASALSSISQAVSGCAYTISVSPPDPDNLAVYLDGNLVSKDSADGWSFGVTPQTIVLNGKTCASVTTGVSSRVQVFFGCPGTTPPPFL